MSPPAASKAPRRPGSCASRARTTWCATATSSTSASTSRKQGPNTVFEAAQASDIEQLCALLAVLFGQETEFAPDAEKQRRALQAILADPRVGRVFVAREGERIVAMASLLYTVSTAEGGRAALFEDLVVAPEARGAGVGPALLQFVIDEARKEGLLRLTLLTDRDNERAQALYRRCGFVDSPMKPMRLALRRKP
jgi:GNAT superfamily N-acetyltransferase